MPKRRIGVFVCHCGRNIAGTVNIEKLVAALEKNPRVAYVTDYKYMCSDPGQKLLEDAIREKKLDAVVIAACSPSMHEDTFRKAGVRAGINPYLVEIANIREQVSWVHDDMERATEKAIRVTETVVEKVWGDEPLQDIEVGVVKRALVVGGGIAGMQAALDIADAGYEVVLVEKSPTIGGHMAQLSETFPTLDCSQCILTPKMVAVSRHPNIRLLTNSEVVDVEGYVGNFKVKIKKRPRYVDPDVCNLCGECERVCPAYAPNEFDRDLNVRKAIYIPFPQAIPAAYVIDPEVCLSFRSFKGVLSGKPIICGRCSEACEAKAINYDEGVEIEEVEVGAIIIATGYDLYGKENIGEYGYGKYENVIDSLQFERMLSSTGPTGGKIVRPSDGKVPKRVAFIQCCGSRDEQHLPYCSKICCMYTAKHAMMYRERVPDGEAYVFYIDIRAGGKGYEEFVKRVQEEFEVKYVRGRVSKLYEEGGKVRVHAADTLLGKPIKMDFDLVVLAMGIVPSPIDELAGALRIQRDSYGFLKEVHPKLRPVESATTGIFIAGAAHGPKDIPDTVAQASAAASKALGILTQEKLQHEPVVCTVDEDVCAACHVCESVCPYGAITVGEVAEVNEVLCEGCGTCVAACPTGAASLRNYRNDQIIAMIRAALRAGGGER